MSDRTDDKLVIDFVAGDENAIRILVQRWEHQVFAFLARMLDSPEEAEDLCQETFLRVIKAAPGYRPEDRFQSWLFRIAGNLARSRLRRRKILRWLPLAPEHDATEAPLRDPLDVLVDEEEQQRVKAAIMRLPERQREALVLKQYQELSYRQIADTMGTTVTAVQMLLHRAMTSLRKDLSRREDKP